MAFPRLSHGVVIRYEDGDIIVIDKPAGLLSVASPASRNKTCYSVLFDYLRKKGRRPAAVHRLDRDTSGLMIFAKSGGTKKKLMDNWDALIVERRYSCLAVWEFTEESGLIDLPLEEDQSGRMLVKKTGKPARTRWKLLKSGGGFSLLALYLETGRRNQIRSHLSFIGHPVAGDAKYWARTNPLKRLCLHADRLCFHHPRDSRLLEFESPAPKGFFRL